MSAVSRARDDAETSKHVDLEVMKVKILRVKSLMVWSVIELMDVL